MNADDDDPVPVTPAADSGKVTAAAVEKLNERFALAVKAGGFGVWDWDLRAGELVWDAHMFELYGRRPDGFSVSGTSWLSCVHPDDRADTQEKLEAAIATGSAFDREFRIVYPDGSIHHIKSYSEVSRDASGEPVRLTGVNFDVTQRREAVAAVEKLNERFALAVKAAGLGVWDWDLRVGELVWDVRMFELYGRRPEDFSVSGTSWLSCVYPSDREATSDALEAAIATGSAFDREFRVVYPDDSIHHIKSYSEVSRDASGEPVRLTGVNFDVTELKEAERAIREMNATLERTVELRTAEVLAANKELEAFAYAVSHDLRTPLRAMTGFCRALEEDYGRQLDETALQYTQHITTAAKSMGELIEGLLVLSRATRGDIQREDVDVSALALAILEGLKMAEPERDADWDIEPGMTVHGDPRMVDAMMRNLIGNAWKYSSGTDHAHVGVFSDEADGMRWVCVRDNGAGFDQAYAGQLFEPFRRLHRQDEFPGVGIGLATVQRIVNRHGGAIRARSEPGQGAEFRFWLPEEGVGPSARA